MPLQEVTRTYLEMRDPAELRPARLADERVRVTEARSCPASFARYLYRTVGRAFDWLDRYEWTEEQWREVVTQPAVSIWLLTCDGAPAGYFELRKHEDGSTEIAYLGLLQEFIGQGLGGHLVTSAIETAWAVGANRVWLHTCSLDAPAALPNYQKRGLRPFKTEIYLL